MASGNQPSRLAAGRQTCRRTCRQACRQTCKQTCKQTCRQADMQADMQAGRHAGGQNGVLESGQAVQTLPACHPPAWYACSLIMHLPLLHGQGKLTRGERPFQPCAPVPAARTARALQRGQQELSSPKKRRGLPGLLTCCTSTKRWLPGGPPCTQ